MREYTIIGKSSISGQPIGRSLESEPGHVGHTYNIETVAECVEDEALLTTLRDLEVDYAQGLALGPIKPLDDIIATL